MSRSNLYDYEVAGLCLEKLQCGGLIDVVLSFVCFRSDESSPDCGGHQASSWTDTPDCSESLIVQTRAKSLSQHDYSIRVCKTDDCKIRRNLFDIDDRPIRPKSSMQCPNFPNDTD